MAEALANSNVDQQELANIVKGLHGRLRKQFREGEKCTGIKMRNVTPELNKLEVLKPSLQKILQKINSSLFLNGSSFQGEKYY